MLTHAEIMHVIEDNDLIHPELIEILEPCLHDHHDELNEFIRKRYMSIYLEDEDES
jgi:hypothetical protein